MNWGLLVGPLLLALVACGGGDAESKADETPQSAAASDPAEATETASAEDMLEQAYRTYIKAFLAGDGATAYGLLSERCRDSQPLSEFAAIAEAAAELYGSVDYKVNSVTADGDEGRVDATYAVEALNSGGGSLWVYEQGEWRSDKCD